MDHSDHTETEGSPLLQDDSTRLFEHNSSNQNFRGLSYVSIGVLCVLWIGLQLSAHKSSFASTGLRKEREQLLSAYAYEFGLDSCAPGLQRSACCSNPNFPVLGGMDVVAMRTIRGGLPPLLGTLDFPAALQTSAGKYVFLFATLENRDMFLADPWLYAPLYGGFDGWEISSNKEIKGDTGKASLGPNADLSQFLTTVSSKRLVLFGSRTNKQKFAAEGAHYETLGLKKWEEWFQDDNEGPFNTRCFQGFTYEEAAEAQQQYADGTLEAANPTGSGMDIVKIDDKLRRKGVPEGMLYYVNMGLKQIERVLLEETTSRGFSMDVVVSDAPSPKDIVLDLDANIIYWTDMVDGTIRSCPADGKFAKEDTDILLDNLFKPALLQHSPSRSRLYFTSMLCSVTDHSPECEGKFLIRWASTPGGDDSYCDGDNILIRMDEGGQCRGMAVDEETNTLYWADSNNGFISKFDLDATCGDSSEKVLEGLDTPAYVEVKNGIMYWVEGSYSGEQIRFTPVDTMVPETLLDGLNIVDGLFVEADFIYWTDKDGIIYKTSISKLLEKDSTERIFQATDKEIHVVVEGLDKAKGLALYYWPAPAGLSFVAETKYTARGDPPIYANYPWTLGPIVEPYLPTTLRVNEPEENAIYEWVYAGNTIQSPFLEMMATKVGAIPIILRQVSEDGTVLKELRGGVHCKYVRREIRSLLPEDRESFFQALEYMVKTPVEEGREKYGPNFRSNEYFVHLHNVQAGARDCDHLHNGNGFLFSHILLTNSFQEGLQIVNPALAVPYWDFTIDGHEVYALHGGDFDYLWNSIMFHPDWFGNAENDNHTVIEGRWAWALKIADEQWDNQVHNSYGMMRAPWNQNKFPYVQRYRSLAGVPVWNVHEGWPTCEYHHHVLSAHDSWIAFAQHIASEPHGTVHGILGGTFNNEAAYDKLEEIGINPDEVYALRSHSFRSPKSLWRMGLAQCPEYCPMETPQDECKCTCGPDIMEKLDDPDTRTTYIKAALTSNGKFGDGEHPYTVEQVKMSIKTVCEAGTLIGDQLESASPADPLFWPMHPTVERLLFWKFLKGGFDNYDWPEDKNYVGAVYGNVKGALCHGHYPHDILPFPVNMDDGDEIPERYTNLQMLKISDPSSADFILPYVYDDYTWPHCISEGYDFDRITGV